MTRADAIARFYLRPRIGGALAYTLVVRESTREERTDPGRDYLTLEIWPAGSRRPRMTIPVGSGMGGWGDRGEIAGCVTAGLAFASEPSCWDDPLEREASEDVGCGAAEAAWSHRTIARWLDADGGGS